MLTELSVTNFKSWSRIDKMRLAPITGLFGANSSGKTSILQFLLMLKQTAESPDRALPLNLGDERSAINLGGIRDVVFSHAKPGEIHMAIAWNMRTPLKIKNPARTPQTLFEGNELAFEATICENEAGRLFVKDLSYQFAGHRFGMERKGGAAPKYELVANGGTFSFMRTQGRPWALPAPVKCYGFPDQVKAYYQNAGFLADLQLAFEELFSRTYYLGPLREYPQRQYTWGGAEPADMGRRGERAVAALLAARRGGVMISRGKGRKKMSLEEYVAHWLQELGLIHSFEVEAIAKDSNLYRVWVRTAPSATRVLITDVGFGVSQILPVLVLCYYVPEHSTILLEQPEIHLHPAVQAGLADVFLDAVKVRNVQIIFESHSEHLLRRMQRRIAEAKIEADQISLYFCNMSDSQSTLVPLDVDMLGSIQNWPESFFGDEFGEIAAITRAAMARRQPQKP